MNDLREVAVKKGIAPEDVFIAKLDDTKDFKGCIYSEDHPQIIRDI